MTRRTRTSITTPWWGKQLSPGKAVRRVAMRGGDVINGFIAGASALWASPRHRNGKRRTVRRRQS